MLILIFQTLPDEPVDAAGEAEDEEMESEMLSTPSILSLKLLPLTKALHAKHGLRHGDYQRYRGYCARRLAR
jgi:signal recognition particle subunit SRP68